jgi:ribosome maturation protein Sdo1
MTYWNLWDIAKVVLRGKFIAVTAHIKKSERSQINDLILHLILLEKQEQANPKTSRRREIIKIKAEINEIEIKKKPYKESMKQKAGTLKKINKIDRPLANLTKMRTAKTQISNM